AGHRRRHRAIHQRHRQHRHRLARRGCTRRADRLRNSLSVFVPERAVGTRFAGWSTDTAVLQPANRVPTHKGTGGHGWARPNISRRVITMDTLFHLILVFPPPGWALV